MKEKNILIFNVSVAFTAFLLCFGKTCYEYGLNTGHSDGLWTIIFFPLIYLAFLIVAVVLLHRKCYFVAPYIVMAVLSIVFIALVWVVFFIAETTATYSSRELWFPIVLTVLSAIMSILYLASAYRFFHKKD